jgi:hypothetical protein
MFYYAQTDFNYEKSRSYFEAVFVVDGDKVLLAYDTEKAQLRQGAPFLQQGAEKQSCPWFDKLTMRAKPLKSLNLILSLSKDEA